MKNRLYHIDLNGKVVECKATIRGCPRKDYSTREAAYTALHLQKEESYLTQVREELEKTVNDPNTPRIFAQLDKSKNPNNNARRFAQQIDDYFLMNGDDPSMMTAKATITQSNLPAKGDHNIVTLMRVPSVDYDNYIIGGRWILKMTNEHDKKYRPGSGSKLELDLNHSFAQEMKKARSFLQETIIANSRGDNSIDVESETNYMLNQVKDLYVSLEEESRGAYKVWEEQNFADIVNPVGTFKDSDPSKIYVDVNYNNSTFRGKVFEEFVNSNTYYHTYFPDVDIRVFDQDKKNGSWWSIYNDNGHWGLQLSTGEETKQIAIKTPEDAKAHMHDFVLHHMSDNSESTVDKKSQYVYDLIKDIDNVIQTRRSANAQKIADDNEREKAQSHKSALFGKNDKKSTIGSLLNLFS